MFSKVRAYNLETDSYDVTYVWWDKDSKPHYAENCVDLIFQLEKEYSDLKESLLIEEGKKMGEILDGRV